MQPIVDNVDHVRSACIAARLAFSLVPAPYSSSAPSVLRYTLLPPVRVARYVPPWAVESVKAMGFRVFR